MLDANWRAGVVDGVRFGYARPDAAKYPAQFLWDSCFHAFAWAHLEPARGREELRSLLRAQEPDGFVGHTIFWDAPIRRSRRAFYNVLDPDDRMTRSIQPPFVALAWEAVAARSSDDPGFAAEGVSALRAYHDWLERERDLDGSGLLAIVQPDECGLDASPKFDRLVRWRAAGFPGFVALVRENRRRAFSLRRSLAEGGFAVHEVLVNVAYALSLQALARMGDTARLDTGRARARRAARAVPGRAQRPLLRPLPRRAARGLDVHEPRAARAARPPARRRDAPRLRARARPPPVLAAVPDPERRRRRADVPSADARPAALLARADVAPVRLDRASGPARARLRRRRAHARRPRGQPRTSLGVPRGTTTRCAARRWARDASGCPRSRWTSQRRIPASSIDRRCPTGYDPMVRATSLPQEK